MAALTPLVEVGVIAPKLKVIAGVVVAVATVPLIPFAVTIDALVTVPELDVKPSSFNLSAALIDPAVDVVAGLIDVTPVPELNNIGAVAVRSAALIYPSAVQGVTYFPR